MSDSFATPWTVTCQAPLSMGFPRLEYWRELPFFSPPDCPNPAIEPTCPALAGEFFTIEPPGKPFGYCKAKDKINCTLVGISVSECSIAVHYMYSHTLHV